MATKKQIAHQRWQAALQEAETHRESAREHLEAAARATVQAEKLREAWWRACLREKRRGSVTPQA